LTLKWAQEVIKNYSEIEIMILKEDVEQSINIWDFVNILENSLPKKLVEKAKDPKNLHEHVLGFALWTANSAFAIIDMLYQIWAWIVKAPYHLYLIISWKWEIEGVENI
jgi:hypothetical protein